MNQVHSYSETTRICGKCHQELPLDAFYTSKNSRYTDCHCKKCRAQHNRMARKKYLQPQVEDRPRHYPIISLIEDREQRINLIRHAKEVVRESVMRKRRRVMNYEL